MDERDIRRWLAERYPDLELSRCFNGAWGVWQKEQKLVSYEMRDGFSFAYLATGRSLVFDIRNRLLGAWVCDEVMKRDPRLWHNPGNLYHEGFVLSKQAEVERERRAKHAQETGLKQWEALKKNERLMNRVFKRMERGDMLGAASEFSLEELYKNAYLENPQELRDKQFWRAVKSFDR